MRSDAEQNRARILEAARTALAVSGNASMQSIAKLAGIGQGTLYRHFPGSPCPHGAPP
jgi:AcrR family transcriptional regulator